MFLIIYNKRPVNSNFIRFDEIKIIEMGDDPEQGMCFVNVYLKKLKHSESNSSNLLSFTVVEEDYNSILEQIFNYCKRNEKLTKEELCT